MKIQSIISILALLTAPLTWCGCAYFGGKSDVLDFREMASDFWDIKQTAESGVENPRIAVVEFTVEYVDASVDLSQSMRLELPGVLCRGFVGLLPEFERYPVPLDSVRSSSAYQRLSGTRLGDVEMGSSIRYPVDGLAALTSSSDVDKTLLDVLEDAQADVALQVHLRVGVRDGRASIEKGSILRGVSQAGTALYESRITLVSHQHVVEEGGSAVDSSAYAEAIRRLFRPYIGLALIAGSRQ